MNASRAVGLAAILVGSLIFAGCGKSTAPGATAPAPTVSVAQPLARVIDEWDEYTGRLVSPQTVEVRPRVSGYIAQVHFKEGGDVAQGDLLFTIDQRPYQAVVDRAQAEVGAAKARVELARGEAKRAESLAASKAISTDTYETRVKTATQAEQAVLSVEAALKTAQLDLEFTEVRAPIAGRISNARVTLGNLVTGGNTTSATLLTTIVSLDPMYCYVEVDEASALRYRQLYRDGKRASALFEKVAAEMELGNEKGFPRKGWLDFVDNQLDPATGTIRTRSVFPNPDKLMAPGFFARVRIPGNGQYNAVLIRDSAISSDQGRPYVLVVDGENKANYRPIKVGPLVDGLRVVREGLAASEKIIVTGLMNARPGLPVNPQTISMVAQSTTNAPVAATPAKP